MDVYLIMLAIASAAIMGLWLGDIAGEAIRDWSEQRKESGKEP